MNEDDDLEAVLRRAGVPRAGSGFLNQRTGCVMDEAVSPEMAKEILRRLARHVEPGEWAAAVEEEPAWEGALRPQ